MVPEEQDVGKTVELSSFVFWRWGRWIDVVVDDFIPVLMDNHFSPIPMTRRNLATY